MEIPEYPDLKPVHAIYDDKLTLGLGRFFLACANAETALIFQLCRLQLHPHSEFRLNNLVPLLGTQNKLLLQQLETLSRMVIPSHHLELKKITAKIRTIFEHRNAIAHNSGLMGSGLKFKTHEMKISPSGKGLKEVCYTASQIDEYTNKLYQLIRFLSERLNDWGIVRLGQFAPLEFEEPAHPQPQNSKPTGQ